MTRFFTVFFLLFSSFGLSADADTAPSELEIRAAAQVFAKDKWEKFLDISKKSAGSCAYFQDGLELGIFKTKRKREAAQVLYRFLCMPK